MKLLHFADLHLDVPFSWAKPESARRRRRNRRESLVRILELAREQRVDAVLCGGDLFEEDRVTPDTVAFLVSAFGSVEVPCYLAPGNHDWLSARSPYLQARWPANVHIYRDDRLQALTLTDGVTLWGAAHRAPANTDGFFAAFRPDRGGIHLALAHASERATLWQQGTKQPHAPFDERELAGAGIDHAFLGHYHLPRDAERYTYPGNPDPLEFGETGERGVVIATLDGEGLLRRERRIVAVSEVHDLEITLDGTTHLEEVSEQIGAAIEPLGGWVRVTVGGEVSPSLEMDLAGLQGLGKHLEGLVVRLDRVTAGYDLAAIAEERTVRGAFVRSTESITDSELRRRVTMSGLRALEGRRDLRVA